MATTNFTGDVTTQMTDLFTQTFEAGVKLNAEASRFWGDMTQKSAETARSEWKRWMDGCAATAEKSLDRARRLTGEHVERSGELFREFASAATATNPGEMADKWGSAWRRSFDALQANFDAATKATNEMTAEWTETVRRETKTAATKAAK